MSVKNQNIAFVILIGGKSTRFGTDKGIFEFLGKPLLSYQLETLYKFNKDIFIIAHSNKQIEKYKEKIQFQENVNFFLDNGELLHDENVRTPMIGLYTAFKELNERGYEKTFVFSCDSPLIKYDVVDLLLRQAEDFDCYIPRWDNLYLEPLFAIYPVEKAFKMTEECLKSENYKLTSIIDDDWKVYYISIEDIIKSIDKNLLTFININGPVDLEKLMKIYQGY